jgi:hypothetical protein
MHPTKTEYQSSCSRKLSQNLLVSRTDFLARWGRALYCIEEHLRFNVLGHSERCTHRSGNVVILKHAIVGGGVTNAAGERQVRVA